MAGRCAVSVVFQSGMDRDVSASVYSGLTIVSWRKAFCKSGRTDCEKRVSNTPEKKWKERKTDSGFCSQSVSERTEDQTESTESSKKE